ncbi:relaxase/mobilization nuclease domain-containing protein [Sphingobium yanoikuyae]|nr:relaxase/mobilization nuclease domain-containing protein [Sphingobium yanoikuyae]
MIVKRIRKARRKKRYLQHVMTAVHMSAAYILDLTTPENHAAHALPAYLLDHYNELREHAEAGEKVAVSGSRNLRSTKLREIQREMAAALHLAPNARDPIEHYVVSFREGEIPDAAQIEQVIEIFVAMMGYKNCQLLWSAHSNTSNFHIHILVTRVDLISGRPVLPAEGWEIDRLHQFAAVIEEAQGWSKEPNAIYTAQGGDVYDVQTGQMVRRADGSHLGLYKRNAKTNARFDNIEPELSSVASAMSAANSWFELHHLLLLQDTRYCLKGSGAMLIVGKKSYKPSTLGRQFSLPALQQKFGPYQPSPLAQQTPHDRYKEAYSRERKRVNEKKKKALQEAREAYLRTIQSIKADSELEVLLAEVRLQMILDEVEAQIKKAFEDARRTIAANQLAHDRWHAEGCPPAIPVTLPAFILPNQWKTENFAYSVSGDANLRIHHIDGRRILSESSAAIAAFNISRESTMLALRRAAQKWPGSALNLTGDHEFIEQCRIEANRLGLSVFHEGQQLIAAPTAMADRSSQRKTSETPIRSQEPHGTQIARKKMVDISNETPQPTDKKLPDVEHIADDLAYLQHLAQKHRGAGR